MIYEQTVTLTIQYDPEVHNDPEEWAWDLILDVTPDEVTLENALHDLNAMFGVETHHEVWNLEGYDDEEALENA